MGQLYLSSFMKQRKGLNPSNVAIRYVAVNSKKPKLVHWCWRLLKVVYLEIFASVHAHNSSLANDRIAWKHN